MIIMIKNVLFQVTRVWISLVAVGKGQPVVPEDFGKQAAEKLLEEI